MVTGKLTPPTDFVLPRLSPARIAISNTAAAPDTGGCGGSPNRILNILEPFVDPLQLDGMPQMSSDMSGNVTLFEFVSIPSLDTSLSSPSVVP